MPLDPSTGLFERSFSYGDARDEGDSVTRADLDFGIDEVLQAANAALASGVFVVGEWSAASGAFPTTRPNGRPIKTHDAWVVTTGGTVNGKTFTAGDWLVALINGGGATYAGYWTRCPAIVPPAILAWADDFASTVGDTFPVGPRHGKTHFLTLGEVGLYQFHQPDAGTPGVWFEISASASSGQSPFFAARSDFVTWTAAQTPPNGAVLWAGGFAYRRDGVSTHIADLPGYTWAGTPHLEHWGVVTSPERTGATTDYTTAVQAAVTAVEGTLIVTGWVKVRDKIVANSRCRLHCSEGRAYGGLVALSDFNMAATAILVPGDSTLSGGIGELGIYCAQDAAAASGLRADLIHYPPAVDVGGITRCTIDALRIEQAWVGFSAIGNSGGMKIGVLEICAFSVPLRIDGPLDFVHIENIHIWPFQASIDANLLALFGDAVATSSIGRCDGLHVINLSSYQQAVQFEQPGTGIIPATFGAVHLDGDGARWINVSGTAEIGGFYSTKSTTPTVSAVRVEGGLLCIAGTIRGGETPQVQVVGGTLQWLGGELKNVSTDEPAVVLSAGTAILADLRLDWSGTRTVPLIDQSGTGRLVVRDLIPSSTSPAQPLIRCQTDVDGAMVDALSLAPHTITLPTITGAPKGTYLSRDRTVLRLPSYADNAAASGAGLPIGTAYRTATGEMRIVV